PLPEGKGEAEAARGFANVPSRAAREAASGSGELPSSPFPSGRGVGSSLHAHTGAVACVAVSPDGTRAVTGGGEHGLWVWDLTARRELRCLAGHRDRVCCACFSPDGRLVLSSALDQTVRLWDLDAGLELKCFDRQTNRSVAFAPDGKTALCGALYDGK